jgi:hypothetical protein
LHCFEIDDRRIGMIDVEEEDEQLEDERRVRLKSVLPRRGARLVYQYDYGDNWQHTVVVESIGDPDERVVYPICVGGQRACPPEDCGGVGGYEELVAALKSPKHPDHDQMLTWVGGYFDPDSFDANSVNRLLRYGR